MYNRAKVILRRTTDKDKRNNLTEAIETFENWIEDYKVYLFYYILSIKMDFKEIRSSDYLASKLHKHFRKIFSLHLIK